MLDPEDFVDGADLLGKMERNDKDTLWLRLADKRVLSIFADRFWDGYKWCIFDGSTPRYSRQRFETEEDAAADLFEEFAYA